MLYVESLHLGLVFQGGMRVLQLLGESGLYVTNEYVSSVWSALAFPVSIRQVMGRNGFLPVPEH